VLEAEPAQARGAGGVSRSATGSLAEPAQLRDEGVVGGGEQHQKQQRQVVVAAGEGEEEEQEQVVVEVEVWGEMEQLEAGASQRAHRARAESRWKPEMEQLEAGARAR
jgi:hypothetical protein